MAKKPLVFSADYSEDKRFDPEFWEGRTSDPSWIPGYSEIVQANDLDKADDFEFQRAQRDHGGKLRTKEDVFRMIGATPQELPVEFAWLPVSGPSGAGVSSVQQNQLDLYMNRQGFRLATKEDLEAHGFGTTQAMRQETDGTIRRGPDTALYVRSGDVARKWEQHKQRKAAEADGARRLDPEFRDGRYVAPTIDEEERSKEHIAH